jgi:hypothetical protein
MEKKIMNSKLLSGGFENRHLNLFSKKITDEMTQVSDISGDSDMSSVLLKIKNLGGPKLETELDEVNDNEDE